MIRTGPLISLTDMRHHRVYERVPDASMLTALPSSMETATEIPKNFYDVDISLVDVR